MVRDCLKVVVVACLGVSTLAAVAEAQQAKKASEWTCQDFLAVGDEIKPRIVYWIEGLNKADKPEVAVVGAKDFERPITVVIEECKKEPKANLWDKIKTYFSKL